MPQRRKGLCLSAGCLRELQKYSNVAKKSDNPETFVRIRGVVLVSKGYNYREVGEILDVTSGSISNWVARYLDGKHAIFGRVVKGIDKVRQIGRVRADQRDKPLRDITINKVRILRVPE